MEPSSSVVLPVEEVATIIFWARIISYCTFASGTVVVLDWLLTFDLEVSLVWRAKWTVMKGLYLLARYLPFVDIVLALYHHFTSNSTVSQCQQLFTASAWTFISGVTLVELIFTFRTWAVWGGGKQFTVALAVIFCAIWAGVFVDGFFYLKLTTHGPSPAPDFFGCFIIKTTPILSIAYILLMLYDAFLLSLMVSRALYIFRLGRKTRLTVVIFSDGIIYFIYIFVISLVNVLFIVRLPDSLHTLMMMFARSMHSVLACRVVLHIREQIELQSNAEFNEDLAHSQSDWLQGMVAPATRRVSFPSNTGV